MRKPTGFFGRHMPFMIHRRALSTDSFTFGDWRQYIASRDDGALQPVRLSQWPLVFLMIGLGLLELVAMAVFLTPALQDHPAPLNYGYVTIMTFIGMFSFGLSAACYFGPYRMVIPVGPKVYDGKRRFWSEEHEMLAQREAPRVLTPDEQEELKTFGPRTMAVLTSITGGKTDG